MNVSAEIAGLKIEEASIHELAKGYGVRRRTVRAALESAVPVPRKVPVRESPALGPHRELVRGWLKADIVDKVPIKQRRTARRVWQRLVEEHGAQASESSFVRCAGTVDSLDRMKINF